MQFTTAELGGTMIVLSIVFYIVGWLPTVRAIMIFLGILLVGLSGHLTSWAAAAMHLLSNVFNAVTVWALGAAVPGILAIVLLAFFIYDLHPKNKSSRRTFWVAAGLALLITIGATNIGVLNNLPARVQQGVTNTQTTIGG